MYSVVPQLGSRSVRICFVPIYTTYVTVAWQASLIQDASRNTQFNSFCRANRISLALVGVVSRENNHAMLLAPGGHGRRPGPRVD